MSENDNNKSTGDVEAQDLAKNWSILSRFQQGQRLKELVASGRSMRGLAKTIGRSEATVRKRVDLANLSPAEREAVESGQASVKGTLKKVRRKRAASAPRIPTDPEAKKQFVEEKARLILGWIGKEIPMDEQAIAKLPELQSAAREAILKHRIEVLEKAREQPFFEREAFGKPLQNRRIPLSRADPHKAIKPCKPKGEMGNTGPDHLNYWIKWFDNWASRIIADWRLRYHVLNRAIQLLEEEIQNPGHG